MSEIATSREYICKRWVSKFTNGVFTIKEGNKIYCEACMQIVPCSKITQLYKHIKSPKHERKLPAFLASKHKYPKRHVDNFNVDLESALNSAGIPLAKVDHPAFKGFLEKYCKRPIPNENALLKIYFKRMKI
ncbi:hypothetical protein ACQ4LE_005239 [Meloidogyne hapla]|uniref:BED-type domain-containing protein n=1 Tax=Meloidogyne hapla TaxID=6305 RepID=A0A1I8B5X8_MELHA